MKIIKAILLLILLFASVLIAQNDEKITLRVFNWAGIFEMPLTQEVVDEYMRRNPNIDILFQPTPDDQYENKILTSLAAGEPPDVFLLDSKSVPSFTNKKVLLDLNQYVDELGIDTSQWFKNVTDIARRDTGLYAFPKGFTPMVIYYNKKLFDAEGINYPSSDWNWDDFLEIAKRLTKDLDGDGKVDQFGTTFTNYFYNWIPWIWSAGADVVSPDGKKATGYLNSPETEEAFQFLIDLRNKYGVAPDVGTWAQSGKTGMTRALFLNNRLGMILDGHWRIPGMIQYIDPDHPDYDPNHSLDLGIVGIPHGPTGKKVNVMYEGGWCVPKNTKHPVEAVKLAAFMAGEFANRVSAGSQLEISTNIKVAKEIAEEDKFGFEEVFLGEVPYCRQPWGSRVERFSEIERILQDAVDEVMLNDKPMHSTMTQYAERIDEKLEQISSHSHYEFKQLEEHTEIIHFLIAVALGVFLIMLILYYKAKGKDKRNTKTGILFLTPSLIHLTVFIFTPIVFSAYLSFHRWDIVVPDKPFVGLDNFKEILSDPTFWNAFKNTFIYTLNVPITMVISLSVALMMHKKLKGIGFLRTLYFLPSVTSFVAISLVWMWIYHPSFGVANFILSILGIPPLEWLNSTQTAMISVIVFSVWLNLGYQMVIFLAGLQGIPDELYEVARIDGASPWRQFWNVTVPLLKPTTFFIMVTSFIGSFQIFTTIYVMTQGGPVGATDVFVYHIYDAAWNQLRMGYASAMSWILFFIILLATWLQFKFGGKNVEYN
ncbi:MAG: extracellular solute-binding protein [Melioribacteraceae bacterium]|nr:extracellular solute-binding protein [Melioribacteraceae bacterium]MCF8353158.1 extracellular solute-binding protein [Melioribacteraceae bacterium]MCF8393142.1 extracellular solute-binding protein [Melioribacteraceae bacterium]MCF8418045.1 extracellular solute-binding protein [Melioribacteraceae bacterium]